MFEMIHELKRGDVYCLSLCIGTGQGGGGMIGQGSVCYDHVLCIIHLLFTIVADSGALSKS